MWTLLQNLPAASYQWNVIQDEAEGGGSFCKILTNLPRHKLSLGDKLTSIKPSLWKRDTHSGFWVSLSAQSNS